MTFVQQYYILTSYTYINIHHVYVDYYNVLYDAA